MWGSASVLGVDFIDQSPAQAQSSVQSQSDGQSQSPKPGQLLSPQSLLDKFILDGFRPTGRVVCGTSVIFNGGVVIMRFSCEGK